MIVFKFGKNNIFWRGHSVGISHLLHPHIASCTTAAKNEKYLQNVEAVWRRWSNYKWLHRCDRTKLSFLLVV